MRPGPTIGQTKMVQLINHMKSALVVPGEVCRPIKIDPGSSTEVGDDLLNHVVISGMVEDGVLEVQEYPDDSSDDWPDTDDSIPAGPAIPGV